MVNVVNYKNLSYYNKKPKASQSNHILFALLLSYNTSVTRV